MHRVDVNNETINDRLQELDVWHWLVNREWTPSIFADTPFLYQVKPVLSASMEQQKLLKVKVSLHIL